MSISCPICLTLSGDYNIKIKDMNFSIYKCSNCGLEYTNPLTNKKKFEILQLNEFQLKIQNIIDLELG